MKSLYLLQYASLIVMMILFVLLLSAKMCVRWANKQYEQSRWMVLIGICMLGIHYYIQLKFDLRALGDDIGALINFFFYIPSLFLLTMGVYNIESSGRRRWHVVGKTCFSYALSLAIFIIGYNRHGSANIGSWLYILLFIFVVNMFYFAYVTTIEVRKKKNVIENLSSTDLFFYTHYVRISIGLIAFSAIVMSFTLISSSYLSVIGPIVLIVITFFTISFIALGYNYMPTEDLLEKKEKAAALSAKKVEQVKKKPVFQPRVVHTGASQSTLSEERVAVIDKALKGWLSIEGYKDTAINMISLANLLNISKSELSRFFSQQKNCTFRMWLSDIRFQAAKQMLTANPNYNNDIISAECGFASRSQLYRIFKQNVGMTPNEWKEHMMHSGQPTDEKLLSNEDNQS